MAKLSVRLILFFLGIQCFFAQESLCVFKANGVSFFDSNKNKDLIKKGSIISTNDLVKVLPNANFIAIDNKGMAYEIDIDGTYRISDLLKFIVKQSNSNFTISYFKHIWAELLNKRDNKVLITGVYRGESLMLSPKDSCKIVNSKITFKWRLKDNNALSYVFIKNIATDELLKIEANGTQLGLYNNNPIFYNGTAFKWAVTDNAFPNLNNIPFYGFNVIEKETYEVLKLGYKDFITDLKTLGTTDTEIETIICEQFSLCK